MCNPTDDDGKAGDAAGQEKMEEEYGWYSTGSDSSSDGTADLSGLRQTGESVLNWFSSQVAAAKSEKELSANSTDDQSIKKGSAKAKVASAASTTDDQSRKKRATKTKKNVSADATTESIANSEKKVPVSAIEDPSIKKSASEIEKKVPASATETPTLKNSAAETEKKVPASATEDQSMKKSGSGSALDCSAVDPAAGVPQFLTIEKKTPVRSSEQFMQSQGSTDLERLEQDVLDAKCMQSQGSNSTLDILEVVQARMSGEFMVCSKKKKKAEPQVVHSMQKSISDSALELMETASEQVEQLPQAPPVESRVGAFASVSPRFVLSSSTETRPPPEEEISTTSVSGLWDEGGSSLSLLTATMVDENDNLLVEAKAVDVKGTHAKVRRTRFAIGVIVLMTVVAAAYMLYKGIHDLNQQAQERFMHNSDGIVAAIESSFRDYEQAALLTHDKCRRARNTTRQEFLEFYQYLLASGMEFDSVQCSPNVTHAERAAYEKEAQDFYAEHHPEVNYSGFIGFTEDLEVVPSPELPFYFPVHYLEPVLPNAPAIDLDMYSFPSQKNEIDLAVTTGQSVISKRLQVVNYDEDTYSVIIYHPGIYLETSDSPDGIPKDLGVILVRIPSVLARVALLQEENLAVYLFDTTAYNTGGAHEFLGAMIYNVEREKDHEQVTNYEQVPELEMEELEESHGRLYEREIPIASGAWKVLVTPIDETYEPNISFVVFGSVMILVVGLGLAIFLYVNTNRWVEKAAADRERDIIRSLLSKALLRKRS